MKSYSLILPVPPTINHYYKRTRTGGIRVSDAGLLFRQEVWVAVKQSQMPRLTGRLVMITRVHPRDKRKQDISNRLKSLEDALQIAGAFVDDEQIDEHKLTRESIVPGGRCEVMLGEIA